MKELSVQVQGTFGKVTHGEDNDMAAGILDGKVMSEKLRTEIAGRVAVLKEKGVIPGLAVILVGNDPASEIYVRNKGKGCEEVGIYSRTIRLPEEADQQALNSEIEKLNADPAIHGILVQLPLPGHLDEQEALARILPEKDVDGFHLINAGHMLTGTEGVVACTPRGALYMIKSTGMDLSGKEAVVIGAISLGNPWRCCFCVRTARSRYATAGQRTWLSIPAGRISL